MNGHLPPEEDLVNVEVKVTAPSEKGKDFIGGIKIVNMKSSGDNYYIQVSLTTPKINNNLINFLRLIRNIDAHFSILKLI